jgi:serine/arginine repetitive matrix protein 2
MSQHDVTRAFQQVPSPSSSSSGHRGASSSPSSTALPLARPSFIYPLPPPAPNPAMPMRTGYAPYPSPVMAHSPSPTMIYSHPIAPSPGPTRMAANGHAPLYTHWVPGSGPAPPAAFRPIPSPYPPQIMSYGPGGPVPMYAQQPQNSMQSPPQVNGGPSGRGRGMPVMGQMLPHASHQHPMYSGSPVMMHATAVPVAQGHGYLPVMTPGRGQPANDHLPPPQHMQHPPTTNHPQHGGFANVPPTTFASSTW